jgi:hypothetical protein
MERASVTQAAFVSRRREAPTVVVKGVEMTFVRLGLHERIRDGTCG